MVKSVVSIHHFILVFILSTERNYRKVSRFSSPKLRHFAFLLTPSKNNNPDIEKYTLVKNNKFFRYVVRT